MSIAPDVVIYLLWRNGCLLLSNAVNDQQHVAVAILRVEEE